MQGQYEDRDIKTIQKSSRGKQEALKGWLIM